MGAATFDRWFLESTDDPTRYLTSGLASFTPDALLSQGFTPSEVGIFRRSVVAMTMSGILFTAIGSSGLFGMKRASAETLGGQPPTVGLTDQNTSLVSANTVAPRRILAIEDSLGVGRQPYMSSLFGQDGYTLTEDAKTGRPISDAASLLQDTYGSQLAQDAAVFIALGTNRHGNTPLDVAAKQLTDLVNNLVPGSNKPRMFFVPPYATTASPLHDSLAADALALKTHASADGYTVIPWDVEAAQHPEYFAGGDGVHENAAGYKANAAYDENAAVSALGTSSTAAPPIKSGPPPPTGNTVPTPPTNTPSSTPDTNVPSSGDIGTAVVTQDATLINSVLLPASSGSTEVMTTATSVVAPLPSKSPEPTATPAPKGGNTPPTGGSAPIGNVSTGVTDPGTTTGGDIGTIAPAGIDPTAALSILQPAGNYQTTLAGDVIVGVSQAFGGMTGQTGRVAAIPAVQPIAPLGPVASRQGGESSAGGLQENARMAQLADAARNAANRRNTVGQCLGGVEDAMDAIGIREPRSPIADSAYQMIGILGKDSRFKEVPNLSKSQLLNLPPGFVVVWTPGKDHPDGHIAVSLGGGKEASDHVQVQITNLAEGSTYRVFMPVGAPMAPPLSTVPRVGTVTAPAASGSSSTTSGSSGPATAFMVGDIGAIGSSALLSPAVFNVLQPVGNMRATIDPSSVLGNSGSSGVTLGDISTGGAVSGSTGASLASTVLTPVGGDSVQAVELPQQPPAGGFTHTPTQPSTGGAVTGTPPRALPSPTPITPPARTSAPATPPMASGSVKERNARTVIGIAKTLGVGQHGALLAIMAGLDESHLTNDANLNVPLSLSNPSREGLGQDGHSLGIMQQQPQYGWSTKGTGPAAISNPAVINQLMTPAYAAEAFIGSPPGSRAPAALSKGLQQVPDWEILQPWVAVQRVQGSATSSGLNYKPFMPEAQTLLNGLWGSSPAVALPVPISTVPPPSPTPTSPPPVLVVAAPPSPAAGSVGTLTGQQTASGGSASAKSGVLVSQASSGGSNDQQNSSQVAPQSAGSFLLGDIGSVMGNSNPLAGILAPAGSYQQSSGDGGQQSYSALQA